MGRNSCYIYVSSNNYVALDGCSKTSSGQITRHALSCSVIMLAITLSESSAREFVLRQLSRINRDDDVV